MESVEFFEVELVIVLFIKEERGVALGRLYFGCFWEGLRRVILVGFWGWGVFEYEEEYCFGRF